MCVHTAAAHARIRLGICVMHVPVCVCTHVFICVYTQAIFKAEDMKGALREVALEVASEAVVRGGWDNEVRVVH